MSADMQVDVVRGEGYVEARGEQKSSWFPEITAAKVKRIAVQCLALLCFVLAAYLGAQGISIPASWTLGGRIFFQSALRSALYCFAGGFVFGMSIRIWEESEKIHDFSSSKELAALRERAPHMSFKALMQRFTIDEIMDYQILPQEVLRSRCRFHFAIEEHFDGQKWLARECYAKGLLTEQEDHLIRYRNLEEYRQNIGFYEER